MGHDDGPNGTGCEDGLPGNGSILSIVFVWKKRH